VQRGSTPAGDPEEIPLGDDTVASRHVRHIEHAGQAGTVGELPTVVADPTAQQFL